MNEVFSRLKDVGFDRKFILEFILPSWWVEEIANTAAGLDHTLLILSRRLSIPFLSLRNKGEPLSIKHFDKNFKCSKKCFFCFPYLKED